MDWSKAKRVLIVTLLFVNLILFGFICLNYYRTFDKNISGPFVQSVLNILSKNEITVKSYIPKNTFSLPSLRVEFEKYMESDLNKKFFDSKGIVEKPSEDFLRISYENKIISILNKRRLRYENTHPKYQTETLDFEKAQEIAKDFLLIHGFQTANMKCTYSEDRGDEYFLSFSNIFEDIILERSYTNFIIRGGQVVSMDRLWLNVLDKSESKVKLIAAPKALLHLTADDSFKGKTIVSIDECFYFDPEEQGYVEDITKAFQGRAIPSWRIQFSDGDDTEIESY